MTTLAPPKLTKTPYTVPSPQQIIRPAMEGNGPDTHLSFHAL